MTIHIDVALDGCSSSKETETRSGRLAETLREWLREDATDDPEELRRAQAELEEFMANVNANRAGERLLYP